MHQVMRMGHKQSGYRPPEQDRRLPALGIAFLLAAVASMWLLVRKKWSRKEAIPLVPFLLVGYLGSVVL